MVRKRGKLDKTGERKEAVTKGQLEDDLDALFRLPLAEFTGARNTLAARLKKSGRGDEAALVKALVKPSVSAWAVNQLYWNHREAFDRLIASGERFHKAQTSRREGRGYARSPRRATRGAYATFRSGNFIAARCRSHPSLDTIRRITTTLEAMSASTHRVLMLHVPGV